MTCTVYQGTTMTGNTRRVEIAPTSPIPFYQQIADILRTRIEAGRDLPPGTPATEYVYPPGSVIPSIERIRQETGRSIMTIRNGIKILIAEGRVQPVSGKAT